MSYSSGFIAESWFTGFCKRAKIIDATRLDLKNVMRELQTHMPRRVEWAKPFIDDLTDPMEWLDKVCKIDCILVLETVAGNTLKVAIDLTLKESQVNRKLNAIGSADFRHVRRALGIDRHWVVLLDNEDFPEEADLLESLYEQADKPDEVALIDWKA